MAPRRLWRFPHAAWPSIARVLDPQVVVEIVHAAAAPGGDTLRLRTLAEAGVRAAVSDWALNGLAAPLGCRAPSKATPCQAQEAGLASCGALERARSKVLAARRRERDAR